MRKLKLPLSLIWLFVLLVGFSNDASCQAPTLNNMLYNKRPEISSPNAAALEKYVEFPTATHTGVAPVSIPLYSIGIKGVELPIGLSYHAGGIKVDEMSSDVGAGWSLTAGGAVSILPNGIMDEISGYPDMGAGNYAKMKNNTLQSGYTGGVIPCATALLYSDPLNPADPYGLYSGGDIALLGGVINETHDTEPDVYAFNYPGKSGKFFVDETGVFRTIPYSEMKINRVMSGGFAAGYTITDEMGSVFEFRVREESIEMQTNAASSFNPSQKTTRTYYLSKITNVHGETIDFYYSTYNSTYDLQKTFTRSRTPMGTDCWQMNSSGSYFSTGWTYGSMTVIGQRLDSIKVSDGSMVVLGYAATNRTDMPGAKALNKIELWRHLWGRKKIKQTTLTQSYSNGRLVLNSVTEAGKPPTILEYQGQLPTRLSFAQDHFGYYNAKGGTTLLPADPYNGFPDGVDRSVVTSEAMQGTLIRMRHPTGGKTEYTYESNDFYIPDTSYRYERQIGAYKVSQPNTTVSVNFTVPPGAENIVMEHTNTYDGSQTHNDYCYIRLTGPNNYSRDFVGNTVPNLPFLNLSPGQYTLSIENVGSTYSAEATLVWYTNVSILPHHEPGGGLRISEIKIFDADNTVALQKKFEYKKHGTTQSSGVISTYPKYISQTNSNIYRQAQSGGSSCTLLSCQLLTQSSNPVSPVFFANGSSVMYKEVVTYSRSKEQNGYSYYKFNVSDIGFNTQSVSYPYAPRISYDWVNGTVLEQKDFAYVNNQYVPVRELVNEYNYTDFNPNVNTDHLHSGYGVRVGIQDPPQICWSVCVGNTIGTTITSINFGLHRYQLYSSAFRMTSSEETVYSTQGTNPFKKSTFVYYDNPNSNQISRIETTNSQGTTDVQQVKYPRDYANYGAAQYLLSKNLVAQPIEKINLLKNAVGDRFVTSGSIVSFKPNSVLPDKEFVYETNGPVAFSAYTASTFNSSGQLLMDAKYKERASFRGYNNIGNLTEWQKKNDIIESLAYSFNNTIPVAEVKNAAANEVFYDGFEEGTGWDSGLTYDASRTHTGRLAAKIVNPSTSEAIVHSQKWLDISLTAPKKFKYSAWVYSDAPTTEIYLFMKTATETGYFSLVDLVGTNVTGKWLLLEKEFTVPANITKLNIRIDNNGSGNVWFDDVRICPSEAQMTSYSYEPLVGLIAKTDINNRSTHYEYDALGRLSVVRDEDRNILKKLCYNYTGEAEACGLTLVGNVIKSGTFTKNNCGTNGTGVSVTYTVVAGTYLASTQPAADALAQADIDANGQAFANSQGSCSWTNQAQSVNYQRNDCGTNGTGTWVTYTVNGGTVTSTVSLADANQQALNNANANAQAHANYFGSCSWVNQQQSSVMTRNNCGTNGTGSSITYYVYNGTFSSTTSLADANQQALNNIATYGQAYANANAGCTWTSQLQSGNFTRNNCAPNYTGSTVTYTIAAGAYSSTSSLAHANTLAVNAVNSGGQSYANTNGTCTPTPCNSSTCGAINQKCVNGVCETGYKVYTSSVWNESIHQYECTYHYEFSDFSWSPNYVEYSGGECPVW